MQSHLEEKAAFIQEKGNLRLQPHVVVICNDVSKIAQGNGCIAYAVVQTDFYYEFHSIIEAMELCLKAVFVFNLQFPNAAYMSWLYLQRAVLGITSKFDRECGKVSQLLQDIK